MQAAYDEGAPSAGDLRLRIAHLLTTANRVIVANAGSMVGTTGVTAIMGYAYWALAARQFAPEVVGFAAASVTAMALLGTVGMLGFGSLLIGELPRQPGAERELIGTALVVVTIAGTLLGTVFATGIGLISPDLASLGMSPLNIGLFGAGVGLTSLSMVLDQAMIGLLRGEVQLSRNVLFATAKLGALALLAFTAQAVTGVDIFVTWIAGIVISLLSMLVLLRRAVWHRPAGAASRPFVLRADLLRRLGGAAAGHHALNLALQAPPLALPLVVTATLSAATNAYFYTAWMIAAFVFIGPFALTTALYAAVSREPDALRQRTRLTLGIASALGVAANVGVFMMAGPVLSLFGSTYAASAETCLRILAIEVFPLIVKDHYVTIARFDGRIGQASAIMSGFGVLRLVAAAGGAAVAGLEGLAIGWVAAACLEAMFVAGPVARTAFGRTTNESVSVQVVAAELTPG